MPRGETTRQKIEKVNATISSLMREMSNTQDTPQFIDWGDLINRLKMYRSDLEDDLALEGGFTIEELPEAFAQPDTDSEPTRADTSPPPECLDEYTSPTSDWNAEKEQHYLENPDVWAREEGFDVEDIEHTQLPFEDDEDDFVPEPTDDELEYDEDEDDVV